MGEHRGTEPGDGVQVSVIWKFPLPKTDMGVVNMPRGAQVLTVQEQGGWGVLWAICDLDAPPVPRTVCIVGTGTADPIPPRDAYVGTFQSQWFVGHVFLGPEPPE